MSTGFGTKSPSANVKLKGRHSPRKVYSTYRPVGATCPKDCALLNAGCYAQQGNVNIHQRRAGDRETDFAAWADGLPDGSLIRWNVSGDVVGDDGESYRDAIREAHEARPWAPEVGRFGVGLKGWLYTHAWRDSAVIAWRDTLPPNVRVVASVDSPDDIRSAQSLGWQTVATVTPTADGQGFSDPEARETKSVGLPCPAQRLDIGCADCMACSRDGVVVFAAHGPASRRATRSLQARRSLQMA